MVVATIAIARRCDRADHNRRNVSTSEKRDGCTSDSVGSNADGPNLERRNKAARAPRGAASPAKPKRKLPSSRSEAESTPLSAKGATKSVAPANAPKLERAKPEREKLTVYIERDVLTALRVQHCARERQELSIATTEALREWLAEQKA